MGDLADLLARSRVAAATGVWPRDLARQVVDELTELAPLAECIEARNALLRAAAARLGGTRWAQGRRLQREIEALTSGAGERDEGDGVRALVASALAVGPADPPRSMRALVRILGTCGTEAAAPPQVDPPQGVGGKVAAC